MPAGLPWPAKLIENAKESSLLNTRRRRNLSNFVDLRTHKNETGAEGPKAQWRGQHILMYAISAAAVN